MCFGPGTMVSCAAAEAFILYPRATCCRCIQGCCTVDVWYSSIVGLFVSRRPSIAGRRALPPAFVSGSSRGGIVVGRCFVNGRAFLSIAGRPFSFRADLQHSSTRYVQGSTSQEEPAIFVFLLRVVCAHLSPRNNDIAVVL